MDSRAWYFMGAYRIYPKLNLGAYYSHFEYARLGAVVPIALGSSYSDDWVVAARIDPNPYFYLKLEAHYLDGNAIGFYPSTNPAGFDRLTRLLAVKIGFSF